jgi:DNA recombination protein Rad52
MQLSDMFIDAANVSSREKGSGVWLSYVEGHRVIQSLNEIYPNAWSFEIKDLSSLYPYRQIKNKTGKDGWEVGFMCQGRLTISYALAASKVYEDVGFGSGISYNSPYDSYESAGKEAVTDCLKRCAKNLGNTFGLALYDKDQEAVLSLDEEGWKKLYTLATRHTNLEVQRQIDVVKNEVKANYNVILPSDMKPYMWKEILTRAWPIYWDSFTSGGKV